MDVLVEAIQDTQHIGGKFRNRLLADERCVILGWREVSLVTLRRGRRLRDVIGDRGLVVDVRECATTTSQPASTR